METYKNFTTLSVIKNILHSVVSLHACLYTGISLVGDIGDQEIVAATSWVTGKYFLVSGFDYYNPLEIRVSDLK